MINKSYGISFCRKVISIIEEEENKLFDETGFGFHMLSEQVIELKKYKALLMKFQYEKDSEFIPSYDPNIHGSFNPD